MKEIKKIIKKREEEKRKIKTVAYYKKALKELDEGMIEKIKIVVRIINEEVMLVDISKYESPYMETIDQDKFSKMGLILSDAEKILNLLTTPKYLVLPEKPKTPDYAFSPKFKVSLPIQDWNTGTQDWNFKYPFNSNFKNLLKVLNEIKPNEDPQKNKKEKNKAQYDNGVLYFEGKEINFNNRQNQKELLATLFEEPLKNWSYDEIQEKWDLQTRDGLVDYPKNYWKKFYSAGDDINKAVAIETQIKDFVIKNTKEIKINPKYV